MCVRHIRPTDGVHAASFPLVQDIAARCPLPISVGGHQTAATGGWRRMAKTGQIPTDTGQKTRARGETPVDLGCGGDASRRAVSRGMMSYE